MQVKKVLFVAAAVIAGLITLACLTGGVLCTIDAYSGSISAIENGIIILFIGGICSLIAAIFGCKAEKLSAQPMITFRPMVVSL
jgi:hypothetical protein